MMLKLVVHLILSIVVFVIPSLWIIYEPIHNAKIRVQGLDEQVEISREDNGYVHIFAQTHQGALFGLGYSHCQDRLMSMVFKRMLLKGQLSQYLGKVVKNVDVMILELGLYYIAQRNYEGLAQKDKQLIDHYSQGINSCVQNRQLPIEMNVLGIEWHEWTGVDTLAVVKLVSYALQFDKIMETLRERVAEVMGEEAALTILGGIHDHQNYNNHQTILAEHEIAKKLNKLDLSKVTSLIDKKQFYGNQYNATTKNNNNNYDNYDNDNSNNGYLLDSMYDSIRNMLDHNRGSNNWVVSSRLSESGGNMMASDPHLDNEIPTAWHLSEMNFMDEKGEERYVSGATMAGIPIYAIGRNNDLCFSVTVLLMDNTDMYLEKLNEEGDKYWFDGEWHNMTIVEHRMMVKDEGEQIVKTRFTRKGPISKYFMMGDGVIDVLDENVSLAWSGFDTRMDYFNDMMSYYLEKDVESFMKKAQKVQIMPLNYLIADKMNNIAYIPMGSHPIKKYIDGGFYKDGTRKEHEWLGYLDYNETVKVMNPDKGWIGTANNKNQPQNQNSHALLYGSTARATRLYQLMDELAASGRKIKVSDFVRMQKDTVDVYMQQEIKNWVELVRKVSKDMKGQKNGWMDDDKMQRMEQTLQMVEGWDGEMDSNSRQAAIIGKWEHVLVKKMMYKFRNHPRSKNLETKLAAVFSIPDFVIRYIRYSNEYYGEEKEHELSWINTICEHDCRQEVVRSLYETMEELSDGQNWGQIHKMVYSHFLFKNVPILNGLLGRSFDCSGNSRTLSVSIPEYRKNSLDGFHSSNLRMIMDMKGNSYYTLDIGQNENYFSRNYDDMFERFKENEYYVMKCGREHRDSYDWKIMIN